ncbi:MAG: GTPase HflX [Clostridia bacterium]|nr:GTPase HflX [Clostridia bacterium]
MDIKSNEQRSERVILAGVHTGRLDKLADTTDESMHELEELAKTAGAEVILHVVQNKSELDPATYMGEGKLAEIKLAISDFKADAVIFDDELSPVQIRNISDFLEVKVLDRSMLILDIFAMRAKSGEGKLQVELAQLKYRLPRLRGLGTSLSRTGAGIGTRGPGETKLESDRRHIRSRISALEEEIRELKKHRDLIRARRKKDGVVTAALVGYTNAGKSTLLNTLTDSNVLAENKLFATLDPTSRAITLEDNRKILLVDTVGFIRKLPHHLVQAFKSTLEEAVVADILLHVIDEANPERDNQIKVVDSVLSDIGATGKPVIAVFNKCDKLDSEAFYHSDIPEYAASLHISAKRKIGINKLLETIADVAPGKKKEILVCLPYSEGSMVNYLHETQMVLSEEYVQEGTKIRLLADREGYEKLRQYVIEGD